MTFPIKKSISTKLFSDERAAFIHKRVLVKIRAKVKRVKSLAPKNNNRRE